MLLCFFNPWRSDAPALSPSVFVPADGRRIISGDQDGLLIVWDAFSGVKLSSLSGHSAAVTAIRWLQVRGGDTDGSNTEVVEQRRIVATASEDSSVRVWEERMTGIGAGGTR